MSKTLINLLLLVLPLISISQDAKKVLVIGIDGCRPDALEVASTPVIDQLIASGIYSPDALNDDITISGPGWSAILCGVWSEKHLVVDNSFSVDDYDTYPSFFQRLEDYDSELHTVSICHWSPINDMIVGDDADFKMNVSSDVTVASEASAYLRDNDPDVMFLHFDEADGVGHSFGFSPDVPQYVSKIEEIDGLIAVVIQAIEDRPTFLQEDWLILITTDHGGLGTSHGGSSIEEENVFVLASGKNVVPELITRDSLITVGEIENCLGDDTELFFDGQNDNVTIAPNALFDFGADQDFTVECRVRTSASGDVAIVGNKNWQSGLNPGFVFSFKFPSGPEWKVNIGDGSRRADIDNGGEIADNEWHTLSVTFDRDGFMKMYQDGNFVDSTDISFIGDISTNAGLWFGTDINEAFDYSGAIAEVRLWNTVIAEDNIATWFCDAVDNAHPQYDNLIGHWRLNEGEGNTEVMDNSINGNSGAISNAIWTNPDTLITFDFDKTPRLTDIFPTALTHLCIPVESSWDLDGRSLIPECASIRVSPYLQDASPNAITIMWETDRGEESVVEWGLSNALGNTTRGTAQPSEGAARIHEVTLTGLERFTKYYYRVKTGSAISDIYSFKTPPFASDKESLRLVAMSDMQRDGAFPDKFQEMVQEGVIDYLNTEYGGELIDNLGLVLIPGDLVVNGNNYNSWEETFFTPGQNLFNQVPVYPVPGNHENNAVYFFQYFKLPNNGTAGFEEHWWYKDYGNLRIIGLDSNNPFSNQEQLDWLDQTLDEACAADSIDFVFAQLHHPHLSELWTPGESDYTGEVITRMEQFTTDCGKPSIHFFGHTHGYSRGNSRDHKHLWINAATAGGAIDNWGEFPNFDYDEFSVSQDEYGFVAVEVTNDDDPRMVIKRIGRGDQDAIVDNEVRDSLTVRRNPSLVSIPTAVFPVNEEVLPECVTLKANDFSSTISGALHGQSHWQVASSVNDFENTVAESWKNFENWYFDVDTQLGDDLTDEEILGLDENSEYWWRVRYRDRELNWSEWAEPVSFRTGASSLSANLLVNSGAEDSLANWTVVQGVVEALPADVCEGTTPYSGSRYFAVGGLCEHSALGRCMQSIDVRMYSDSIDAGQFIANFGGFFSNFNGNDLPEMKLTFLDENNVELSTSASLSSLNSSWSRLSMEAAIPAQTRIIEVELTGTRNSGTDNDSYFDELYLKLGSAVTDCSVISSVVNQPTRAIKNLQVIPNPTETEGHILLENANDSKTKLFLVDSKGSKVACAIKYQSDRIIIERGELVSGAYFFLVRRSGSLIGSGKLIII